MFIMESMNTIAKIAVTVLFVFGDDDDAGLLLSLPPLLLRFRRLSDFSDVMVPLSLVVYGRLSVVGSLLPSLLLYCCLLLLCQFVKVIQGHCPKKLFSF